MVQRISISPSLKHTHINPYFQARVNCLSFFFHLPINLSLWLAETYWDHWFAGWGLVPSELFNINWCVLAINCSATFYPYPHFPFLAVCSQDQLMKHSQPNCFRIFVLIRGWKEQNFQKRISLFPIMLERGVVFWCKFLILLCKINTIYFIRVKLLCFSSSCRSLIIQIHF